MFLQTLLLTFKMYHKGNFRIIALKWDTIHWMVLQVVYHAINAIFQTMKEKSVLLVCLPSFWTSFTIPIALQLVCDDTIYQLSCGKYLTAMVFNSQLRIISPFAFSAELWLVQALIYLLFLFISLCISSCYHCSSVF